MRALERQPVTWLLWRSELRELFRPLSEAEQHALAAARAGESFGDICMRVCDHFREDEAPAQAAALPAWLDPVRTDHRTVVAYNRGPSSRTALMPRRQSSPTRSR